MLPAVLNFGSYKAALFVYKNLIYLIRDHTHDLLKKSDLYRLHLSSMAVELMVDKVEILKGHDSVYT